MKKTVKGSAKKTKAPAKSSAKKTPVKKAKVNPIPEGYHTVTPYLCVRDAEKALEFYKKAFGAIEIVRMADPSNGKIGHAEIKIGNSMIMLADEFPEMGFKSPQMFGGSPVSIHLYVEDVDALARKAIKAGAKVIREVKDQFYGDRNGAVEDPFGQTWYMSTHIEDVTPEEIEKRLKAMSN